MGMKDKTDKEQPKWSTVERKISRSLPSIFPPPTPRSNELNVVVEEGETAQISSHITVTNLWPNIVIRSDKKEGLYSYLGNYERIQEGDNIRCGPHLYRVGPIEKYVDSSRVICRH